MDLKKCFRCAQVAVATVLGAGLFFSCEIDREEIPVSSGKLEVAFGGNNMLMNVANFTYYYMDSKGNITSEALTSANCNSTVAKSISSIYATNAFATTYKFSSFPVEFTVAMIYDLNDDYVDNSETYSVKHAYKVTFTGSNAETPSSGKSQSAEDVPGSNLEEYLDFYQDYWMNTYQIDVYGNLTVVDKVEWDVQGTISDVGDLSSDGISYLGELIDTYAETISSKELTAQLLQIYLLNIDSAIDEIYEGLIQEGYTFTASVTIKLVYSSEDADEEYTKIIVLNPDGTWEEGEELDLSEILGYAHSYMTSVINYYFAKSDRNCWLVFYPYDDSSYWDGDATVWGQGSGLAAYVNMLEATEGSVVESIYTDMEDQVFEGIQNFWITDSRNGVTAYSCYPADGNDRFFDDNVWIGLDMADWYTITGDERYLTQAELVWEYLTTYGWDETCGGGVHWKELGDASTTKNTCSTAPTAVLSCKLYEITGEADYLDWAIKCYDYCIDVLQDPDDHLFWDNVSPDSDDSTLPGDIDTSKYSYNSGQPLQAACMLYNITGESAYLEEAEAIAESCHDYWFTEYTSSELDLTFNILVSGSAWFNTVMCRGFFELYDITGDRTYIDDIENSMLHAWKSSCHQVNNLLNDDNLQGTTTMTTWEILQQGALVELFARLAVLENEGK